MSDEKVLTKEIADQFLAEYRDKKEIAPLLKPQEVTNE